MLELAKISIHVELCILVILTVLVVIIPATSEKNGNGSGDYNHTSLMSENLSSPLQSHNHLYYVQNFCVNSTIDCQLITCTSSGPWLDSGYCATYSEDTRTLSIASCPYFQPRASGYNITKNGKISIQLPRNLSQLNDYMCGPLNRKGVVCSECADGFGPSVTSFGYRCVNCTDAWYGVPLFLFLEFFPTTVLYVIILAFQISVTSAPMPCFIMYAQFVVIAYYLSIFDNNSFREAIFTERGHIRIDMQVNHAFYGVFNLDFFQFLKPSVCISNNLKSIHVVFLGYISVLYPILLIILTWICVELHGRNFRPLVWLWRPFHRCFVRLRRGWDTRSDIIDVFVSFFLLSYSRCVYQTALFFSIQAIRSYDERGHCYKVDNRAVVDLSIRIGNREHLLFVIPAAVFFFVYNILPPLLLILYPFKVFRSCLSKCHLNIIVVNTFVEKLNSCYRNGLDGGRDMRSLSGLYFFLRMVIYIVGLTSYRLLRGYTDNIWLFNEVWFPTGAVFLLTALTIAIVRPYQKAYMSYIDALLLSNLALCCFVMTSKVFILLVTKILFVPPMVGFILVLLRKAYASIDFKKLFCRCCTLRVSKQMQQSERSADDIEVIVSEEQLPFIQPATVRNGINHYGTNNFT